MRIVRGDTLLLQIMVSRGLEAMTCGMGFVHKHGGRLFARMDDICNSLPIFYVRWMGLFLVQRDFSIRS